MRTAEAFRGSLLSRDFVSRLPVQFAARVDDPGAVRARARLDRWVRAVESSIGPASGLAAVHDAAAVPLFKLLGFHAVLQTGVLDDASSVRLVVSHLVSRDGSRLPLIVGHWQERIEALARRAVREAVAAGSRWGLCFNGRTIRVVDADRPLARRFLEFDLRESIEDERARGLLWATLRASAISPCGSEGTSFLAELAAASDALRGEVSDALQRGVRQALAMLAAALRATRSGHRTTTSALVLQALTILYRILFLLFAEARSLVPTWHPVYRDSYSVEALRRLAERDAPSPGLWETLQAMWRLAHEGCTSDELPVTPFNGQLFAPEACPLAERASIDDETMRAVIAALTIAPVGGSASRNRTAAVARRTTSGHAISYADLGVEQLGAIYERVLDEAPDIEAHLDADLPSPSTIRDSAKVRVSLRRKESGTFYTPRGMAEHLVRETLGPLVASAGPEQILRLRIVDPAMGSGAFLVAACRFLADAYVQAQDRERSQQGTGTGEERRADARRLVAQRCLFGVDINPVAVQLARLSLWLATLAADAPLTFLDHHLCLGDSLVGASPDDLARAPSNTARAVQRSTRRRSDNATLPLFLGREVESLMRALMPIRERLCGPDDSVAAVREKAQALDAVRRTGALAKWMSLADMWCATWFWRGPDAAPPATAWGDLCDYVVRGRSMLSHQLANAWLARGRSIADRMKFLHWTLQFPEVFYDAEGQPLERCGFDAVVGNPPWDMVRADAREPGFRAESRTLATGLNRFARHAGIYHPSAEAHLNRYQLFIERSLSLLRPGGRLGMVVPWGLAADHSCARLRRRLLERSDVHSLIAFENTEGIFPIHRSTRFLLLTTTVGQPTDAMRCRFGETSVHALDRPVTRGEAHATRHDVGPVVVSVDLLRRISGESLGIPYVRDTRDVALLDRLYGRWPALSSPDGWQASFGRELNATDDRALFGRGPEGMRVIEGKHVMPFRIAESRSGSVVSPRDIPGLARRIPTVLRPRLAYRDVSSATNVRTLIAAMLPAGVVSTHTLSCLRSRLDVEAQWCLCALLNSFVADYLVRLRVTTHVTVSLVSRLPVPRPIRSGAAFEALSSMAREISTADDDRRGTTIARLQAVAAREYDITEEDFRYILSTFPLVPEAERRAALDEFRGTVSGQRPR
jgi:N-6 DNA Methylase/Eco57I restriction-modification methylase